MRITLTPSALSDLEGIKAYSQGEGVPHIGEAYIVEIIEHIETL